MPFELPKPTALTKPLVKPNAMIAYDAWRKNPNPDTLGSVIHAHLPDIRKNLMIYKGSLAPELLESEGKKLAIQAIKSYNPQAGASLKTHIVNHLQRLHRITQSRARAFRMPEELQQQVSNYQDVYSELSEELGREPTVSEISHKMKWPIAKVQRLRKQFVSELPEGAQSYEAGLQSNMPLDDRLVYVYHDLAPRDQLIFEHLTGFGGRPLKKKSEIAKILGVSPAVITQRSVHIHNKIKDAYGIGGEANE